MPGRKILRPPTLLSAAQKLSALPRFGGSGPVPLVTKTNLIAWWAFDEASGNALDSHTNALHLTDVNTVGAVAGKVSGARDLVRANAEGFTRTSEALLHLADDYWNIFGWAKSNSWDGVITPLFSKWDDSTQCEWLLRYTDSVSRFTFEIDSNGSVAGKTVLTANSLGAPSTGVWYFYIVRHDPIANTISIQFNNGTVDSTAHSGGAYASGTDLLRVGKMGGTTRQWNGLVDEFGIIKGELLTADQGDWLWNGGAGRSYAELG